MGSNVTVKKKERKKYVKFSLKMLMSDLSLNENNKSIYRIYCQREKVKIFIKQEN